MFAPFIIGENEDIKRYSKRANWSRQKLRSIRGQMLSMEEPERLEYLERILKNRKVKK